MPPKTAKYLVGWVCVLCLGACGLKEQKPAASYMASRVLVVLDTGLLGGPLQAALGEHLAPFMPALPQPEPLLDLIYVPPSAFNATLKKSASLFFVLVKGVQNPENERIRSYFSSLESVQQPIKGAQLHVFSNVYARDQQVAVLVAEDVTAAIHWLGEQGAQLQQYFERAVRAQNIARLRPLTNDTLAAGLRQRLGFGLHVPKHFSIAKEDSAFVWMRFYDKDVDKNIFIYKMPYTSTKPFEDPSSFRERITAKYLRDGERNDLYITRQAIPSLVRKEIRFVVGEYALRVSGLWMLSDRSMGGAFVGYLVPMPEQGMLYYLEAFLYHPAGKKRDKLRELEAMLWTFDLS